MSHLLPQSSHWLQVLQCCFQIAPGVRRPGSCPEPSDRLFLLLLLRWAKVRKSHPSAGKPPIKHQKNFTSLGYVNSHKLIKKHESISKSGPRPGQCYWLLPNCITKMFYTVFLCTKITTGILGFFLVGLLPILQWDPGVIPGTWAVKNWGTGSAKLVTVTSMIKDMKRDKGFKLKQQKDKERHKHREGQRGELLFHHLFLRTEYHMPWLAVKACCSAGHCSGSMQRRNTYSKDVGCSSSTPTSSSPVLQVLFFFVIFFNERWLP